MYRMVRPYPPHRHTPTRLTPNREHTSRTTMLCIAQKDHEIVASICGVSTINVELVMNELSLEMWSSLHGSQSCITIACAHDHGPSGFHLGFFVWGEDCM